MARLYAVTFTAATLPATNALDVFEISPADDKPVRFAGLTLDNVGVAADAGDAQEELLSVAVIRGYTSSGSGGSTPTPVPLDPNSAAAAFTAETNNTTVANTGTTTTPAAFGWNVRVPLREFWPEELQPQASQANTTMVVRIAAGGADTISFNGTLYVVEL